MTLPMMKSLVCLLVAAVPRASAFSWSWGGTPVSLVFETQTTGKPDLDNQLADQAAAALNRRLWAFSLSGKAERLGSGRVGLNFSVSEDPEGTVALLLKPGRLEMRLADPGKTKPGPGQTTVDDFVIDSKTGGVRRVPVVVEKTARLAGGVKSAAVVASQGQPQVQIAFDEENARRFAEVTRGSVGRPLAMILDGRLLSAPVIRDEIRGGQVVIAGNFTSDDAKAFARVLAGGELPAGLNLVKQTIGGKEVPIAKAAPSQTAPAAAPRAPAAAQEPPAPVSDVDAPPPLLARGAIDGAAVVIGVEHSRQGLPRADFAAKDARVFADYLVKTLGYREENVALLLDERAAKSDLEKYLEDWLPRKSAAGAPVVVFYSGHGAPDPTHGTAYLVPYDGDPAFLAKTAYPLARLYENLGKLPGRRPIVLLDACFSGAGRRSALAKGARPLVSKLAPPPSPPRLAVLSAAASDQIGGSYDEQGHGLFTYFVLRALRDAAAQGRAPTASELFEAVAGKVEAQARRQSGNEQTPQLQAPGEAGKNSL